MITAIKNILTTCLLVCTVFQLSAQKAKPIVIGNSIEVSSKILSEKRTLNIYLPEGYNEKDTISYPVIYLLDGGLDEDFIHVIGLVQFNTFPWINRVPKSIVVGVANTDRKRDMSFPTKIKADKKQFPGTGGSEKFIAFIEKELQPFIQKTYHCNHSKTLIGQSLAGLLAAEILLKKPALFDRYIIISPSLWWDNGSLLQLKSSLTNAHPATKTGVYIAVGKEGLTPGEIPHVMEVDANLLAEKIKEVQNKNIDLHFDYLPDENHATVSHQAIFNAFRKLYPVQKE